MIPYILYASLILTACLIFYKLLLQKETFFSLNRFVLMACMFMAFILPVIHVPQQLSFRKAPIAVDSGITAYPLQNNSSQNLQQNPQTISNETSPQSQAISFSRVMQWLIYLYWFGVIVFALNFLMQAAVLLYKAYSRPVIIDGKFRIVEIAGDKAPCSFGNNIFINPEKYDWETFNQVLLHEKIHIEQKHTLDLLLAEIVLIFQWFNPFAWLWRKELEKNLEYFTDHKLLQRDGVKKESYQVSLLKVAAPHFPLSLTTNYNQSLLKNRIVMMNAKKSNVHTAWKYFFLLPLMVLFVCLFNDPIAKSQSVSAKTNTKVHHGDNDELKTEGAWFATIKKDEINFQFKSGDDMSSSNGNSFNLSEFKDLPRDKAGTFTMTRDPGVMEFKGKFEGNKGMGDYKFTANKAYVDEMKKEGIDVTKDRDAMVFFFVNVTRSYVPMLKKQGFTDIDKDKLIPLAALDVNESYITSIKQAFPNIDLEQLIPFRALNIDKAYIDEIRNAGYKNLSTDKVITFKAQGIDGKYIADFKNSAKAEIPEKNELKEQKEKEEIPERDNADEDKENDHDRNRKHDADKDDDDDNLIAFKALNIDNTFVNSFKAIGYNNLSNDELISMKAIGVTPEYVKGFKSAGYGNLKPDELVGLKSQNITPEIIKQYKDLGFTNVDINDVIGAKATGTSPSFIKSMRDKGHNMKSLDKYIALRSVLGE